MSAGTCSSAASTRRELLLFDRLAVWGPKEFAKVSETVFAAPDESFRAPVSRGDSHYVPALIDVMRD